MSLQQHEAAFQLIWACIENASEYEERGGDSMSWEHWDERADKLLLEAASHFVSSWQSVDLKEQVEHMELENKSGSDYGYDTVAQKSLAKLKAMQEAASVIDVS